MSASNSHGPLLSCSVGVYCPNVSCGSSKVKMIVELTRYERRRGSISHRIIGDDRALSRRNRLCPRVCRFPPPTRVGGGRSPSTLVVFKRKRTRPLLRNIDRLFWVTLRQWWPGWADALIIVKAETVVSWHRAGFRLFWRLSSRPLGRPKINEQIRALIRRMKADNPGWGAPRIHGELLALGFDVSEPTVSRYLRRLRCPWRIHKIMRRSESGAALDNGFATGKI